MQSDNSRRGRREEKGTCGHSSWVLPGIQIFPQSLSQAWQPKGSWECHCISLEPLATEAPWKCAWQGPHCRLLVHLLGLSTGMGWCTLPQSKEDYEAQRICIIRSKQNFYSTNSYYIVFLICKVFLKKNKATVTKEFKNQLDRWVVARPGQFCLGNSLKIHTPSQGGRWYRTKYDDMSHENAMISASKMAQHVKAPSVQA